MEQMMQERIGAALNKLTAWNGAFWGIGGAAGGLDWEQYETLLMLAWELEEIISTYGVES